MARVRERERESERERENREGYGERNTAKGRGREGDGSREHEKGMDRNIIQSEGNRERVRERESGRQRGAEGTMGETGERQNRTNQTILLDLALLGLRGLVLHPYEAAEQLAHSPICMPRLESSNLLTPTRIKCPRHNRQRNESMDLLVARRCAHHVALAGELRRQSKSEPSHTTQRHATIDKHDGW